MAWANGTAVTNGLNEMEALIQTSNFRNLLFPMSGCVTAVGRDTPVLLACIAASLVFAKLLLGPEENCVPLSLSLHICDTNFLRKGCLSRGMRRHVVLPFEHPSVSEFFTFHISGAKSDGCMAQGPPTGLKANNMVCS